MDLLTIYSAVDKVVSVAIFLPLIKSDHVNTIQPAERSHVLPNS